MMSFRLLTLFLLLSMFALAGMAGAQGFKANYDESKVPKYTLPDPLICNDGQKVTDAATWRNKRRPEIFKMFQRHVYGKAPGRPKKMKFEVLSVDRQALNGKAVRKEVAVYFNGQKNGPKMTILIYLPAAAKNLCPSSWD